ncbi:MAG: zf-HC2 domain-containing protein [Deltaproteobacteria bacterium]|nr:MAG: zf-HC2 domain-containing protein [Deltaproteobacteria bacterium]
MTCADVERLVDAFADAELPAPTLLAVARHAAGCSTCDESVRGLQELHESVTRVVRAEVDALDLADVWPAVAAAADRVDARRSWSRRARAVPAAAAGALAVAAAAVFWLQSARVAPPRDPTPAHRTLSNQAFIDRLAGKDLRLRREPRSGTTIIWVNATSGGLAR